LADKNRDGTGDEKRWDETKKNMLSRVPFRQVERFENGTVEAFVVYGQVVNADKDSQCCEKELPFLVPRHGL
jgi:hypothetical protein